MFEPYTRNLSLEELKRRISLTQLLILANHAAGNPFDRTLSDNYARMQREFVVASSSQAYSSRTTR